MDNNFEPTIIGFTCNWCSYRASDLAGTARMKYAPNVRLIGTLPGTPELQADQPMRVVFDDDAKARGLPQFEPA